MQPKINYRRKPIPVLLWNARYGEMQAARWAKHGRLEQAQRSLTIAKESRQELERRGIPVHKEVVYAIQDSDA